MIKYSLPTELEVSGEILKIRSDYRVILDIIEALNDPDFDNSEKALTTIQILYLDWEKALANAQEATQKAYWFISGGSETTKTSNKPPVMSWVQDFELIIAPVNRVLGFEARSAEYLHWWTFLSGYMEIGECTFSTFVNIREKLQTHKKLEDWEKRIYRENYDRIVLKKQVDSQTQAAIDDILGG